MTSIEQQQDNKATLTTEGQRIFEDLTFKFREGTVRYQERFCTEPDRMDRANVHAASEEFNERFPQMKAICRDLVTTHPLDSSKPYAISEVTVAPRTLGGLALRNIREMAAEVYEGIVEARWR